MPDRLSISLPALAASAPAGDSWIHEIKLDGYRLLVRIEQGQVRFISRNGRDWTTRLPELAAAAASLQVTECFLDTELVAMDREGRTDYEALQRVARAGRRGKTGLLLLQAFDLMHLNGYDLTGAPLLDRKNLLHEVLIAGDPRIRYTDHIVGCGPEFFAQACELGLEGIVSKKIDSRYEAGRTRRWLKVKCTKTEVFIVGGYTTAGGGLRGLHVGREQGGELVYAGRVSSGISTKAAVVLLPRLKSQRVSDPPFDRGLPDGRRAQWTRPVVRVEINYLELTDNGRVRHASFKRVVDG